MIKFFRHIRKRLLKENRFTRYTLYALGEIILVVIGILIALQVNDWNEQRKLKSEEIELLREMRSALTSDLEDIRSNIDEHESALRSCRLISNAFNEGLPYHDSLKFYFGDALNTTRFGHSSGPYETLKTKGADLVTNDSLRLKLSEYYDRSVAYQFDLQELSLEGFASAKERQFELFKGFNIYKGLEPVDYNALRQNQYYISWLDYTANTRWWEAKKFRELKDKAEHLLRLLDDELNRN
ncbi:MAG: hypothetical protein HKO93_03155 [Flavobacteriales bacterium]|nr:hypothetical protein [Flavobacteriales bacterium]